MISAGLTRIRLAEQDEFLRRRAVQRYPETDERPARLSADGFTDWYTAMTSAAVPIEPRRIDDRPFHAVLDTATIGRLSLLSIRASGHCVVRTEQVARKSELGPYKVIVQIAGAGVLDQGGRECVLRPGDLTLSDTARPYRQVYQEDFQLAVLLFPRDALPLPAALLDRFIARPLPREGAGAVLRDCLRSLYAHATACEEQVRQQLASACMELLGATLTQSASDTRAATAASRRLQVLAWIREHLADEGLRPSVVADAHHMSVRYLHRLFEDQDMSVAGYIRHQRLARLYGDLENPLLVDRSIGVLAARWGFRDQPYLTRLFRDEYGVTPGQVRREARTPRLSTVDRHRSAPAG